LMADLADFERSMNSKLDRLDYRVAEGTLRLNRAGGPGGGAAGGLDALGPAMRQ